MPARYPGTGPAHPSGAGGPPLRGNHYCGNGRVRRVTLECNLCQHLPMDATLVLGQQGRLVIPADVRAVLDLAPGDRLHLRLTGRRLVLERPQDAAAELRGLAASVPASRSLVDELLAERREAAAGE